MFGFKESNVNIYIVDDDILLLKILENQFKKTTKYNILTFKTGEDFLHYYISNPVKKTKIQIVLLDYNLSTKGSVVKDGIEILKYIKDISKNVNVIMLSGQITPIISDKSLRLGAETCIKKNENSFIRIQNNIKWIISERVIKDKKRKSKFTLKVFLLILVIVGLVGGLKFFGLI